MKNVCIITGGGSGMGLATAKHISKDKIIIITGRTLSKLQQAVQELQQLGYEVYAKTCDTSIREQVQELVQFATNYGTIKQVIHAAGVSPSMASAEQLIRINALGTVYMNEEFSKVMNEGSVIVNIASNSAYVLPNFLANKKVFALADTNETLFIQKMLKLPNLIRDAYRSSGLAYALSKKFVIWYSAKMAFTLGKKHIRVVSLSPGLISTDMGNKEASEGMSVIETTTEKRMGTPDELGFAIASIADERNSYLAGVDILCDGGSTIGKQFR